MAPDAQRQRLTRYLEEVLDLSPEYLWARYPDYAVFRHPGSRKWLALFAGVPRPHLGLPGEGRQQLLTLKCDPALIGPLLSQPGFRPAYHLNRSTWISILLDGQVPDEAILPLLDLAHRSVAPKKHI